MGILTRIIKKKTVISTLVGELKKNKLKMKKTTVNDTAKMVLMFDDVFNYLKKASANMDIESQKYIYVMAHNVMMDAGSKLVTNKLQELSNKNVTPVKIDDKPGYIG